MKRLIKRPMTALWRWSHPLRRPFVRKAEAFIRRACLEKAAPSPVPMICHVTEESGLLMDHMVREMVRLQKRVEHLQEAVEGLGDSGARLSVVGGDGGVQGLARSAAG